MTIYLVRHAHAGSRHDWDGRDEQRPLSGRGTEQAQALLKRFGDEPITRVLSSPATRCAQTVAPIARHRGLDVEDSEALAEGSGSIAAVVLIRELAGDDVEAVLCSHGDVIPAVMRALADQGVKVEGGRFGVSKGATFVIEVKKGKPVRATYVERPDT